MLKNNIELDIKTKCIEQSTTQAQGGTTTLGEYDTPIIPLN